LYAGPKGNASLNVFERFDRFAFGLYRVNPLGHIPMRYFVERFCPVEIPIEHPCVFKLGAHSPLTLREVLIAGFGEGRSMGGLQRARND
jgi:hypothetical protein